MKHALWLLRWILKAAIFFTLFAFALNNQQEASVNLFFGLSWHAPLVLIVLAVFTIGLIVGVLAMVPRWWRVRKIARNPSPARSQAGDLQVSVPSNQQSASGQHADLSHTAATSNVNSLRDSRLPGS